ncbi:MAG: GNAT family N-acetyltransferase [Gammaproteobacteria bacterium]|nr:GNAT family N-acetyltransferase [Gammaproteobacteria bacterium]
MPITIKQPKTEKEFDAYYDLRWRVLREPWNQPQGSEKDELENDSFHIMVCGENNNVIGVGRLHFNNKKEAQIRYMAVDPEYTNKGFGKLILGALEEKAEQEQCEVIVLDARENAIGFYEKNNYKLLKKNHLLFGTIQHYRMRKTII